MNRRSVAVVALACLLATAGSLGVLDSGAETAPTPSPSPGETPTVPPGEAASPTPTVTLTRAAIGLPPGVGGSLSGSPERMALTHDTTLHNTSFTLRYSRVRIEDGDTEVRILGTVQYDGTGTTYSNYTAIDHNSSVRRSIEVWSTRTIAYRLVTFPNETFVQTRPPVTRRLTFADRIETYLGAFETGVTGYSRLGEESTVRVSGSGFDYFGNGSPSEQLVAQFWILGIDEADGGSVSMEVNNGVVRQYRAEVLGSGDHGPVTLRETVAFSNLGTTTIRKPGWVDGENETEGG